MFFEDTSVRQTRAEKGIQMLLLAVSENNVPGHSKTYKTMCTQQRFRSAYVSESMSSEGPNTDQIAQMCELICILPLCNSGAVRVYAVCHSICIFWMQYCIF